MGKKVFSTNGIIELDKHMQIKKKRETESLPYTIHKNKFEMDHISKPVFLNPFFIITSSS